MEKIYYYRRHNGELVPSDRPILNPNAVKIGSMPMEFVGVSDGSLYYRLMKESVRVKEIQKRVREMGIIFDHALDEEHALLSFELNEIRQAAMEADAKVSEKITLPTLQTEGMDANGNRINFSDPVGPNTTEQEFIRRFTQR